MVGRKRAEDWFLRWRSCPIGAKPRIPGPFRNSNSNELRSHFDVVAADQSYPRKVRLLLFHRTLLPTVRRNQWMPTANELILVTYIGWMIPLRNYNTHRNLSPFKNFQISKAAQKQSRSTVFRVVVVVEEKLMSSKTWRVHFAYPSQLVTTVSNGTTDLFLP